MCAGSRPWNALKVKNKTLKSILKSAVNQSKGAKTGAM